MGATLSLHRLFYTDDGYLKQLQVPPKDHVTLSAAREEIRATLRLAFRDWEQHVSRVELFDGLLAKSAAAAQLPMPKFRVQGSFCYQTANDCQQTPPQQIDLDDGLFLPISFIINNGKVRPALASKAYFKLVEKALQPLCAARGWRLNPGAPKDSCVRVEIGSRLHVDIPLYAIADAAFEQLAEASARTLAKAEGLSVLAEDVRDRVELAEDVYQGFLPTEIMLAHRRLGWLESDPRKLERWFQTALSIYGPIVRRLSRAFKGLRDAHWDECDLGSICIMAAAVTALTRVGRLEAGRDDLALLRVGREMVKIFGEPIDNPVFPGDAEKRLCNGWTPDFREEVQEVFADACDKLERAINDTLHKGHAVRLAREAFGERVPDDESLVTLVGAAAVVRQTPPTPQPKPMVPRTTSG